MRLVKSTAAICLMLAALLSVTTSPARAQDDAPTPPTPAPLDPADTLQRAEAAVQQADRANQSAQDATQRAEDLLDISERLLSQVGNLLGYIQTLLALGGVAAAALAAIGFFRLRQADRSLADISEQLKKVMDDANTQLQQARELHQQELDALRDRANATMRALALLQLAETQFEAGNPTGALTTLEQAYELAPANQTVNYLLAELSLHQGQIDRALDHLNRTLEIDPEYPPALAAKGYALRLTSSQEEDAGEKAALYAEAEALLLRALNREPHLRDPYKESYYATLGGLYRRRGLTDQAVRAYTEAERITPHSSYPVSNLATLYALKGDREHAEQYFRRTLELAEREYISQPGDNWNLLDIGLSRLYLGDLAGAQDAYQRVINRVQTPDYFESALAVLRDLRGASGAPEGIDEVISQLEQAVGELREPTP